MMDFMRLFEFGEVPRPLGIHEGASSTSKESMAKRAGDEIFRLFPVYNDRQDAKRDS